MYRIFSTVENRWKWIVFFAILQLTCFSSEAIKIRCVNMNTGHDVEYDASTEVCCNGVHRKFIKGHEHRCCIKISKDGDTERELYNITTSLCCGGVLYKLQPEQMRMNPVCCGDQVLMNHSAQFCCGQKLYTYSTKHFNCFSRGDISFPIEEGDKVCYKQNATETIIKLYKEEEVKEKGQSSDCCGLHLYQRGGTHFCFKNTLFPQGEVPEECGPHRTVHDASKTVCCQDTGKLIPIGMYASKYHDTLPNLVCFKGKLVDLDKDKIVYNGDDGKIIPKHLDQCGPDTYDPQNRRVRGICCDGKLHFHSLNDMNAMCCGKELIDKSKHNCCNDRKIPKSQKCCGDTVYDIYNIDVICCNRQLYNNSYLCCKPQSSVEIPTLKQNRNDNTCCGKTTFHPLVAMCCDGKVEFGSKGCDLRDEVEKKSVATPRPGKVIKDTVHQIIAANQKTPRNLVCQACLQYETPDSNCVKRFKFQVYVFDITEKRGRTRLHVLFLEPKFMRKTRMVLFTSGKCKCFKQNTIYDIYTNRNLKDKVKVSNRFRSHFTVKDMFYKVKGNFGKFYKDNTCQVERYYRPIVS